MGDSMMKRLSWIVFLLAIAAPFAISGLPPTTLKGQSDTSAPTTFNIQVPAHQATALGGPNVLIETGNHNILKNPGFEGSGNWTASGGATAAINTTAALSGKQGYDWDSNAAGQTLTSDAITIPEGLKGHNAVVACNIKTVSGTATTTLSAYDGTTAINPTAITSVSGGSAITAVNFIAPSSGTIALQLKSVASNEPEIYIDDCVLEDASYYNYGVSQITSPWYSDLSWTFSSGFGTTTNASIFYRRVGSDMEVRGDFTAGTTSGTVAYLQLPSGYTINTTALPSNSSGTGVGVAYQLNSTSTAINSDYRAVFYDGSTNNEVFFAAHDSSTAFTKDNVSTVWASDTAGHFDFKIPITQYTNASVYRPDQTPASWSGYQDGWTGSSTDCGTSSATFADPGACTGITLHQSTAQNITCTQTSGSLPGIDCTFPAAGQYPVCATYHLNPLTTGHRIEAELLAAGSAINHGQESAPGGSNQYSSAQICGVYNASSSGTVTLNLRIASQADSADLIVPVLGAGISWLVGDAARAAASPLLVNQVSSNTSGQERVERVSVTSYCTSSPCTIASQSGSWASSVTRTGTGSYTLNIVSGEFSSTPICVCSTGGAGAGGSCSNFTNTSSTAVSFQTFSPSSGTTADGSFNLICMGPH